ncbi:MAG: SprT family zinc-dependent metalloprotease, partial [Methanoregula sp.]|nr:SprT family zinc-dependent metalloprotease [Methanoregula sp.]
WIRQHLMGDKMPERPTASADGYKDSLTYNGTTIDFAVQFKSSVSRVTIKVKPDRSVAVVAPVTVNRTELHNYILGKADWIHAQVTTTKRQVAVRRKFCDGETYPYLGGTLTVRITRNKADVSVVLNGSNIVINIPPDVIPAMEQGFIRKCVESLVKSQTLRVSVPKVIQFAAAFGVRAPQVDVRLNKGKWGYCSTRGMITFASELCLLPPRLFDYVVAHEVCHRLVMYHSPRFWSNLCTVMPDCQKRRAELKRDSPLYRIFLD